MMSKLYDHILDTLDRFRMSKIGSREIILCQGEEIISDILLFLKNEF